MLYSTAILALAAVATAASIPAERSIKTRDLVNGDPQDLGNCPEDGDADACTFEKSVSSVDASSAYTCSEKLT